MWELITRILPSLSRWGLFILEWITFIAKLAPLQDHNRNYIKVGQTETLRILGTTTNEPNHRQVVEVTIDQNIRLFEQRSRLDDRRPVILIFGWPRAKQRYLRKYTDIYLAEGCDVVQIQIGLTEMFIPEIARGVVKRVRSLCEETGRQTQPVFVHTFCSSIYLYGELLTMTTDTNKDGGKNFVDRICGQIHDSPVDLIDLPNGLAMSKTNNKLLQSFIKLIFELYLRLAITSTKAYHRASTIVKANVTGIPGKLIYSLEDKYCNTKTIDALHVWYLKRGLIAQVETWNNVPHLSIYRYYPDKYSRTVSEFLSLCAKGKKMSESDCRMYSYVAHM